MNPLPPPVRPPAPPRRPWNLLGAVLAFCLAPPFPATADIDRLDNLVLLDAETEELIGIVTEEAEPVLFEQTVLALGRIEVLPGNRHVVASRIPGRAVEVHVRPDHEVARDATVVVIEGRMPGDPPPLIPLRAPIRGFVDQLHVAPGEPVSPDRPLLSIVDLSQVYGIARVPDHLAGRLRPGMPVRARVPGWPEDVWETRIEHIGALADPESNTLEAACHLENAGLWLRPGMRAEFTIVLASRNGVEALPRGALRGTPLRRHVYIRDHELDHAFVRVPVIVGELNDRHFEVLGGLLPGDEVVVRGAHLLDHAGRGTVSLKEALDAAHGHAHNEDGSEMTDHDPDHDNARGPAGTPAGLVWFLASLSAVLAVLLGLSLVRRHNGAAEPVPQPVPPPHA